MTEFLRNKCLVSKVLQQTILYCTQKHSVLWPVNEFQPAAFVNSAVCTVARHEGHSVSSGTDLDDDGDVVADDEVTSSPTTT